RDAPARRQRCLAAPSSPLGPIPSPSCQAGNRIRRPLIIGQRARGSRPANLDICPKELQAHAVKHHAHSRGVHPMEGSTMAGEVNRRDFLSTLGVSVGATLASAGATLPVVGVAHAQDKPTGTIPDKPYPIGHMTVFTTPASVRTSLTQAVGRRPDLAAVSEQGLAKAATVLPPPSGVVVRHQRLRAREGGHEEADAAIRSRSGTLAQTRQD